MILQFCRCGGLLNAKGHPDGFLSHFSSLRNFWLGGFSCSLTGCGPPVSVYSIRCAAVNRMFSFDVRPSWRVAGNGIPLPAEHLQFVQGVDKTVCTDCVCSGAQRAPWAGATMEAFPANVQCLQVCHCEAPKGPWQSREGSFVFADGFPAIRL